MSKPSMVIMRLCNFSLYANKSCDEHAIYFRRFLKYDTPYSSRCSRPLIFVYLCARTETIQK